MHQRLSTRENGRVCARFDPLRDAIKNARFWPMCEVRDHPVL
jgi:hypothetical protein